MDEFLNDDVILPDEGESTPAEPTESNETIEGTDTIEPTEPTEEGTEGESTPAEPTEPFLKIKYNKEEVPLTQEEVIALSQKGMNYDKLQERYNQAINNPNLMYLNELANKNGMEVDELVGYWRKQEEEAALNELIQNNIPEEMAQEILENRKFRQQMEQERKAKEIEASREQDWKRQQDEFMEIYPDVNPKDIPQDVWDMWRNGTELKFAYMQHQNQELIKENAILKQNDKNSKASPIKIGVTANGSNDVEKEDAFLIGFNSI